MATKNVELGTVGFNLEANDADLAKSLVTLKKFGQEVTRASAATDEAGQKIYGKMVQVERAITGVFDRVSSLADGMAKTGASADAISKLTSQYDALANAMIKASRAPEAHEFVRTSVGLNAATAQATRALKEQADATSLLHSKQTALVNAYERTQNLQGRMQQRGASPDDLTKISAAYSAYAHTIENGVHSTNDLKDANRAFKMELGEVTRGLQASTAAANQAERQQARLIQATRNTAYVNARAARMNLPATMTDANSSALSGLGSALQSGNIHATVAAQQKLNDALMATRMAMIGAEAPVSRMSIALHDFSRASVLALGPLSGVGARISVMTALLDSNTVSVALFIGGAVAMGAALYGVSAAAIAATTAQQQFNAQLTSATGSPLLVAKEYEYLLNTANKLGIGVKGLVKPYSDFAASARLSGMAGADQRKVFEAITVTGTALRWSTEQQGRAFLALTQMISKATVMSEEYKKQLGELIPNIIGLGAEAEKTSTQGMMKMMKNSDLLTLTHLPKLAEVLQRTFGPAAAEGAATITAQQERLGNAVFETAKRFDEATKISEAYRSALILLTDGMNYLGKNMSTVVAVMGAMAGAGAGYLFMRFLMAIPALAIAAGTAITAVATGSSTLLVALNALSMTSVVGWVLKLTAAVIGAVAAFTFFNGKAEETLSKSQQINDKLEDWIKLQESAGKTQKRTHSEMVNLAGERLDVLTAEIAKEQALIKKREDALAATKAVDAAGKDLFGKKSSLRDSNSALTEDPIIVAAKQRTKVLQEEYDRLKGQFKRLSELKIAPDPLAGDDDKKDRGAAAWESWSDRVSKSIAKVAGEQSSLKAFAEGGVAAQKLSEALTKAQALYADMPKGGNVARVAAELTKAGYSGKNLVEQFQQMFVAEDAAEEKLKGITSGLKDQKAASQDVLDLWEKLSVRRVAISGDVEGMGPEKARQAKQLQQDLTALNKLYKDLGVSEEAITGALKLYADEWQKVTGAEDHQKAVERVTRELDRLNLKIGDTPEKLDKAYKRTVGVIEEAVKLEIITRQQADVLIAKSGEDVYRKLTGAQDDYYKKLQQMMGRLENSIVDSFVSGGKGGISAFSSMLSEMVKEIMGFAIRIAFVKPLMANLFGSLYTGDKGSGTGILGGMLTSIGGMLGGPAGASAGAVLGGSYDYNDLGALAGMRATGGDVNPFSSYVVGENGPEVLKMGNRPGTVTANKGGGQGGDQPLAITWAPSFSIDARSDQAQIAAMVGSALAESQKQMMSKLKAMRVI